MVDRFVAAAKHVRVPATSANLGSGYDSLGLALTLYDDVVASVRAAGLMVDVTGEGVDLARDETHLLVRAMRATFDRLGAQPSGLELICTNRIPHGRGLGSSAAAIVAGVVLARALSVDGEQALPDAAAFALAAELEGHPDNVAACFYGGLTVSWAESGTFRALPVEVQAPVTPIALIPEHTSSTSVVRGLLPDTVAHGDAAFALARSALLVGLLSASRPAAPAQLLAATDDRLHQPFRAPAMLDTAALVHALRADGHPAFVSGAGPSVLVLAEDQVEVDAVLAAAPEGWRAAALAVDGGGVVLVPGGGDGR